MTIPPSPPDIMTPPQFYATTHSTILYLPAHEIILFFTLAGPSWEESHNIPLRSGESSYLLVSPPPSLFFSLPYPCTLFSLYERPTCTLSTICFHRVEINFKKYKLFKTFDRDCVHTNVKGSSRCKIEPSLLPILRYQP